jgi:ubiquinone/menaquinone biosynthesis C-methylase UbiE
MAEGSAENGRERTRPPGGEPESLFERFPWLYAFCRDHLFRDDTELMASALWPAREPGGGSRLLELGCGPGFYSRQLAGIFGQLRVVGVDRSERQLRRARYLAATGRLGNCLFVKGDARALPMADASFDAVLISRLFIILPERDRVLAEMYRVLKPGGRCFVAEPRSALRAAVPLRAMWMLKGLASPFSNGKRPAAYLEPGRVSVMSAGEFDAVVGSQPWRYVRRWHDTWYQYAVCEKGTG